jgi:hypothetical protein
MPKSKDMKIKISLLLMICLLTGKEIQARAPFSNLRFAVGFLQSY